MCVVVWYKHLYSTFTQALLHMRLWLSILKFADIYPKIQLLRQGKAGHKQGLIGYIGCKRIRKQDD